VRYYCMTGQLQIPKNLKCISSDELDMDHAIWIRNPNVNAVVTDKTAER
jgi:hypothetical protein